MSIGESDGGLPPDALVEREADILEDCIRVIDAHHDASVQSMCRVGIAPCSPFSVSRELMRDAAILARDKKVMLHTHLAENEEDIAYSQEKFGCRPGQYAEDLGWTGEDVNRKCWGIVAYHGALRQSTPLDMVPTVPPLIVKNAPDPCAVELQFHTYVTT